MSQSRARREEGSATPRCRAHRRPGAQCRPDDASPDQPRPPERGAKTVRARVTYHPQMTWGTTVRRTSPSACCLLLLLLAPHAGATTPVPPLSGTFELVAGRSDDIEHAIDQ